MYKINLKENVSNKFRETVNEYINFSINKTYNNNKKEKAWNSLCAIMDRIDDLVIYLNEKELNNGRWKRCAFDFFEFIEQSAVLIECIDGAYKIYGIDSPKSNIIFKHKIFNDNYINQSGKSYEKLKTSDKDYFEYIRALSSVHPSKTDRHKEFQCADLEVSPFVVWKGGIYSLDSRCNGEIVLVTYSNGSESLLTNKAIYINEIFNFIKFKYYSLNKLSKYVDKYNKYQINFLRNEKLKRIDDFESYNDYLDYLIDESKNRCCGLEDDIKEIKSILNSKKIKKENEVQFEKYCNALKFSINVIRRQLQNMDFKCNSICDSLVSDLLQGKIYEQNDGGIDYSYYQGKISDLKFDGNKSYSMACYKELIPFYKKYINISSKNDFLGYSCKELYILSQIAIYFHELENDGVINKIIPKTKDYR